MEYIKYTYLHIFLTVASDLGPNHPINVHVEPVLKGMADVTIRYIFNGCQHLQSRFIRVIFTRLCK